MRISLVAALVACGFVASCGAGAADSPDIVLRFGDAAAGDTVSLRSVGGTVVEWVDRTEGEVYRLDVAAVDVPEVVARVPVSTLGEQWGLLGTATIDGRRFATWTVEGAGDLRNGRLVVGELTDDGTTRSVWESGRIGSAAVGGHLAVLDGQLLLGVGQNVDWGGEEDERGALLLLDPDGAVGQDPQVLSTGYVNPFAFLVTANGDVWVADNAAGDDPEQAGEEDVERIGRADLGDRADLTASSSPDRAPSAMVELPDGRIGICGFLDNEMRAYEVSESEPTTLERAGTITTCNAAAAVLPDGSIVTSGTTDEGEALFLLTADTARP